MQAPKLFRAMVASVFAILFVGLVGGLIGAPTPASIPYQGRLLDAGGSPLDGTFTMRFIVYTDAVAGSSLSDTGNQQVQVDDGLFQTELDVDLADFDGQELFLQVIVNGEQLSPRQPLRPAPYALSVLPGSSVVLDTGSGAARGFASFTPATGTALYADASGGVGVFADSESNYGVWGSSNNGWGGYFTSDGGYGLRVDTQGSDHYDHGIYVTSQGGYGVYSQSDDNQGVRGEAGDVTGITQPLGAVGVVGIGQNRGTYGASEFGTGLYGLSDGNYGLWGQSINWRGVTGRTSRPDNNYGFYTPDNLFSSNLNRAGSTSQVARNAGSEPIEPGDVVVYAGIAPALEKGGAPVVLVAKAGTIESAGIAGVVETRFNVGVTLSSFDEEYTRAVQEASLRKDRARIEELQRLATPTLPGPAGEGDYVLVVVHGPARVKASAVATGAIRTGDQLVLGELPGIARRLEAPSEDEPSPTASRLGHALESLAAGEETIYVYVR